METHADRELNAQRQRQRRLLAAAPPAVKPSASHPRPKPNREAERLLRDCADELINGQAGGFLDATAISAAARLAYEALASVEVAHNDVTETLLGQRIFDLRKAPAGPESPSSDLGRALIELVGTLAAADALSDDLGP